MGTKKVESTIISSIENQESWDRLMKFNGLFVADLYQEWNGPCRSVVSLFNKLHAEINDERITFAQVKVDNIRSLSMYKGKCEPTFLFIGGGQLVGIVRGSNAPIIRLICLKKFDEEIKVMKGEIERNVIRDPGVTRSDSIEDVPAEYVFDFIEGEMTFAIIKPEIIESNKIDEIIEIIRKEGFEIIKKEILQLSREEVLTLYSKITSIDSIEEVINYISSGKSCTLALRSEIYNPVIKLREITGPADVENAKETQPDSLRAIYGLSGFKNGIHSAQSREEALKSISVIFPNLVYKKKETTLEDMERTLILIPENIYSEEKKSIVNQLENANLKILKQNETTLTKFDINFLYKNIIVTRDLLDDRIEEIHSSNFAVILVLGKNSINIVNFMLGLYIPEDYMDYRPLMVRDIEVPELIYASLTKEHANRDESYFFQIQQTFAIIKPDAYEQRDEIIKLVKAEGFTIAIANSVILTTDEAENIYRNIKEMPYFAEVIENMINGTSLIMVLSKYDAVYYWRDFIGSVNPEEAAEQSPDKLRGIFGSTVIQNALHSSSTAEDAIRCINLLFGNLQFDERGNVCAQKLPGSEESFPFIIYRPIYIEESKIQDVIKRLQFDKEMELKQIEKEFSFRELSKLYCSLKNPDSFQNIKCFVEIATNIIPILFHEENDAFQKIDLINQSSRCQKNNRIRLDLWKSKFEEQSVVPEINYMIYKYCNSEK